MKLIDDWKTKFPKLWSVRMSFWAALASAVDVGFEMFANGTVPWLVVLAMFISFGAAVARIIAQTGLD